jgi:sugar diacid utilization regulator
VRRLLVLPGREAKNDFHLRLVVLDARGFVTGTADTDKLESLDGAVEARAEGAVVAILSEIVVLVLALFLV